MSNTNLSLFQLGIQLPRSFLPFIFSLVFATASYKQTISSTFLFYYLTPAISQLCNDFMMYMTTYCIRLTCFTVPTDRSIHLNHLHSRPLPPHLRPLHGLAWQRAFRGWRSVQKVFFRGRWWTCLMADRYSLSTSRLIREMRPCAPYRAGARLGGSEGGRR